MSTRQLTFAESFTLSGFAACCSKTVAAPIERVKLLIQSQDELIKQGILDRPYKGIISCAARTFKTEGFLAFWRGNFASVIRYIPMQAMNFAFKDTINAKFKKPKNDTNMKKLYRNTLSGGLAGSISITGMTPILRPTGLLQKIRTYKWFFVIWFFIILKLKL